MAEERSNHLRQPSGHPDSADANAALAAIMSARQGRAHVARLAQDRGAGKRRVDCRAAVGPHRNRLGAFSAARRQGPPCPPRRSARSISPECTVKCCPGRMLDLVQPPPVEDSCCADDQITHRGHDSEPPSLSLRCGVDSGTPVSSRSVGQGGTSAGLGSLVQPCHTLFNLPPSRRCPMLITRSPSRLALRFLIMSQRVTAHPMTATLIGRIP